MPQISNIHFVETLIAIGNANTQKPGKDFVWVWGSGFPETGGSNLTHEGFPGERLGVEESVMQSLARFGFIRWKTDPYFELTTEGVQEYQRLKK